MKHSIDFFKDEIRNGFYIPTAIKIAWANALDVLGEIDRICLKYDISYYADWGTFLGAVRHHGIIPWDDDLDICMKRDDYIRFREVADNELPENYDIHDYARHEDHWLFLARVVNNRKICFDPAYLNDHYNFPWLSGVDIFVKDYLYAEPEDEKARDRQILDILACADGLIDKVLDRQTAGKRILQIEKAHNVKIPFKGNDRETAVSLYALAEQLMSRIRPEDSDTIGQIFPWVLKNGLSSGESKADYGKGIRVPFEDTSIPIPENYSKVLSGKYRNYHQIKKVWGGHDYPYFESQKKELEKLSGSPFPSFRFAASMLQRPEPDRENSLKTISPECLSGMEEYISEISNSLLSGETEALGELFQGILQLTEDFGTLIENTKGENRESVKNIVSILQEFCSVLVESYNSFAEKGVPIDTDILRAALSKVSDGVKTNITNVNAVLFLTTGPVEWRSFLKFYLESCSSENTEIFVAPLPTLVKDVYGNLLSEDSISYHDNVAEYEGLSPNHFTDYRTINLSLLCPDTVYIQNPYDGENPLLTVPKQFYAENLRHFTDRLIYVPIGKTSEFEENDLTDMYNLKIYANAPGVIYSDKVVVQSENIRLRYINSLCEFAGPGTKKEWEQKIIVS